jgi:low temperature requirement protein LtrA
MIAEKTVRRVVPFIYTNLAAILFLCASMAIRNVDALIYRIAFWTLSIALDFIVQIYTSRRGKNVPYRGSHLPERMGLFTIIVLGLSTLLLDI